MGERSMTGLQNLDFLSTSLEDLSLGNKLLLRQQKDRPMLKYSSSAPGPSSEQMMKQADSNMCYANGDAHVVTTGSAPTSPVKYHPSINAHMPPSTNPYARPLSAKDIQPSTPSSPQSALAKRKSIESPFANGFNASSSSSNLVNTFLRPQSGTRRRGESSAPSAQSPVRGGHKITKPMPPTGLVRNEPQLLSKAMQNKPPVGPHRPKSLVNEDRTRSTTAASTGSYTFSSVTDAKSKFMSKVNSVNNNIMTNKGPAPGRLERERPLSVKDNAGNPSKEKPNVSTADSRSRATAVNRRDSSPANTGRRELTHKLSKSPASSDGEGSSRETPKKSNKHVPRPPPGTKVTTVASRPPSATSRPISALSRPGSASEIAAKVRNVNYSPSKPYVELVESSSAINSSKVEPEGDATSSVTLTGSVVTKESSSVSEGSSGSDSIASKTVYYHKESKASKGSRPEYRSLADGAPSQMVKREALSAATTTTLGESEGEEWEDEGEESEFSGAPSVSERMPGDGEADDMEDDDMEDDDEAIDNLDDDGDDLVSSDDESIIDSLSITSGSIHRSALNRLKSAATKKRPPAPAKLRPRSAVPTDSVSTPVVKTEPQSPLTASLFSNVPPVITFVAEGETVEQLPWDIRKFLKWRMCSITPNVVKNCIARSGFRPTKKSHDWLGCWGKHMKATGFKAVRDYQKLNHFPGSFQIGRKDRLWRNLSKMQVHFGKKEFSFFPQTFVLPFDMKQLKRAWEDAGNKQKWIIKPPASARGIGIKVIHKWNQIPKKRPVIVQKYLGKPYLINESKFDMRIYVYVACYDPLRIYVFEDGLTRFASMKYSSSMKSLNNKYMHLTNYSINKKNADYQSNSDDGVCQGHKWSLKALWGYLKKKGVDTKQIWENIKDLIVKTIISSESAVNSMIKSNVRSRYSVHELFGFDVMLDDALKPWVLEVNISPSLHSNSQLDINVKGQMIKDLHNLAGFRIPEKSDVTETPCKSGIPKELLMDKRLYSTQLAPDERAKHAYYCQKWQDETVIPTILDIYTPDDLRVLIETIDEDSRRGGFQRVFPKYNTHKYLKYFEAPRYHNLLLDQFLQAYHRQEARGVAMLDSYCQKNIHVENPTGDPYHQWCPPSARGDMRTTSAPVNKLKGEHSLSLLSLNSAQQLPKIKKKSKVPKVSGLRVDSLVSSRSCRQIQVPS